MTYLTLSKDNIQSEHICCAFSDRKCAQGYEAKKLWLTNAFDQGYVLQRLDERAKVFIEYGPAETAWVPVTAPNYLLLGCFWVSGRYKGQGHGKALMQEVVNAARRQKKNGVLAVVGTRKFHFMSDTAWLLGQGFTVVESLDSGFSLLSLDLKESRERPGFNASARSGLSPVKTGLSVYYSNRCPYAEHHVIQSLAETARKRRLPLSVTKLATMEQAQSAPSPATIFSLFLDGRFVTTDISVCLDSRFDKIVGRQR